MSSHKKSGVAVIQVDWGPVVRSAPSFVLAKLRAKVGAAPPDATPDFLWRYAPYLLLSLLILGPLLLPGFVLTMDMVFTPTLRLPDHVDNTYLFYGLLHVLNFVMPADLLQKVILVAILLFSGIGAHRMLSRLIPSAGASLYAGGILYMLNPFVYDRFMAGQYGVLLGYALLPWFVSSLLSFLEAPDWRKIVQLSGWAVIAGIVSIHSLGLLVILSAVAAVWKRKALHWRTLGLAAAGLGIWLALNSYWLIPTLAGQGRIAESVVGFGESQRQAFATIDVNGLGTVGSVLGLQGFWQDGRGLYILPNDLWGWGLVQVAVWVLLIVGFVRAWRAQREISVYFVIVGLIGLILAIGLGSNWMATHLPFFAGYREPQKFAALVALAYAYGMVWGTGWLLRNMNRQVAIGAVTLLLIAYTPTMLWGFAGQLRAAQYPIDWFAANTQLSHETRQGSVLFLPWHLYMSYGFAGRIIASPAPAFFNRKIIASNDPELAGVSPQTSSSVRDSIQNRLLPDAAAGKPVARQLRGMDIAYILVAKEYDYRTYDFLETQPHMTIIRDNSALRIYKLDDTIGQHANN